MPVTPVKSETLTQLTAPNLRLEAASGVTYAYRRFGNRSTGAFHACDRWE